MATGETAFVGDSVAGGAENDTGATSARRTEILSVGDVVSCVKT